MTLPLVGNDSYPDLFPAARPGVPPKCSVVGCKRGVATNCALCVRGVCDRHTRSTLGMMLCFSCYMGMQEGMPDEVKGPY